MFCKLALRNVRRSFRDYSVYFLTLAFGVCVFYTFNALEGQSVLRYLGESQHYMVESILSMMNGFSVFVSVILAGVILYANTFMMKRRKKELGTYFLLGLPTGKVAALLSLETLLIGILALAAGTAAGVLFSFGLSALSGALFQVSVDFLSLTFSPGAMGKTVLYFGIVFLLVMLFNGVSTARCRLIDLIQAERRSEDMKEQPVGRSVGLFLAGAALIGAAYAMILTLGFFAGGSLFFLMLGMGAAGTLLFFRSLSGFVLRVCRSRKKSYYKGLNMFTLRQFNSKIHTTYLSMTAICLMLLLAIGATACALGMNNAINTVADEPFDLVISNYDADQESIDLLAALNRGGLDTEEAFAESCQVDFYYPDEELEDVSGVLRQSDYNALVAMTGGEPLSLAEGETAEGDGDFLRDVFGMACVVVRDERAEGLLLRRQALAAQYAGDKETVERQVQDALSQSEVFSKDLLYSVQSRMNAYMDALGSKVLVIFLGLYLGLVFLLSSAAVLALQQLSQAADNARRYAALARLGAEEKQRDRSVFIQVALAFLAPLGLALVHSAVGLTAAQRLIEEVGKLNTAASVGVTAAFLVVIYGAYFLATCLGCRRLARGK